jgi:hypothetical protein
MHILEIAFTGKTPPHPPPKKTQALSNPGPTALSVLYKNQKNARIGSKIFRSQLFDEFPHYSTPSVIHRFCLGRKIQTQLYYFTTIRLISLLRPNTLRISQYQLPNGRFGTMQLRRKQFSHPPTSTPFHSPLTLLLFFPTRALNFPPSQYMVASTDPV